MPTVERPLGVTITAVVAILGSALLIVVALFTVRMAFGNVPVSAPQPLPPGYLRTISLGMGFGMLAIAAWGITTAVGLFKLRGWSRLSVLVFSALLLFMGASAGFSMALVPMPADPRAAPHIMNSIRTSIVGVYAALGLLGAYWLVYFNRPHVRAQFGYGPVAMESGGRPLSVTIIGWTLVIFGVFIIPFSFFSPFPRVLFGVLLGAVSSRLVYLAYGMAQIGIGIGLLRLNPLSRVLAVAFFVVAILNAVVSAAMPADKIEQVLASTPAAFRIQDPSQLIGFMRAGLIPAFIINLVPIWFLIVRRGAFNKAGAVGPPPLPPTPV